jgi:arylsulfatase A-like enzyme
MGLQLPNRRRRLAHHKERFFHLHVHDWDDDAGAECLCYSQEGRQFIATKSGIQISADDGPTQVILTVPDRGRVTGVAIGGKDKDTLYAFCGNKIWKRKIQQHALGAWSPWTKVGSTNLMTGKHAARLHFTIWSEGAQQGGPKNRKLREAPAIWNLPHTETTIARHLHGAGYLTALVGKWHLGDWEHYPEAHGFDINIGGTNWGAPQTFWWPYSGSGRFGAEFRYVPQLEFGKPGEYLTDRLTDEAMKVIDHAEEQPFFIYLAHHAVHTPIEAKEDAVKHFDAKLRPDMHHQHGVYAAMTKNLDENVGRILDHLKELGLDKNTLVIFASDNGGYVGNDKAGGRTMPVTNNTPLRSGKGSLYEGGVRIPLLISAGPVCRRPARPAMNPW